MPYDENGNFTRLYGKTGWQDDRDANTKILVISAKVFFPCYGVFRYIFNYIKMLGILLCMLIFAGFLR